MANKKKIAKRKKQQARKYNTSYNTSFKSIETVLLGITLLITFIAFSPTFNNNFIYWDDDIYVLENPNIYELDGKSVAKMFSEPMVSNYHPLTILSLAINYQISEFDPFSYQLVNILLHLIAVALVYYLVLLLTGHKYIGLIAAAIFGLHPMHVESVTWISGRKDVLYAVFFLGAFIIYLKHYVKSKKISHYLLVLFLFLLSCLSKPSAIILPVLLLFTDWYTKRTTNERLVRLGVEKVPMFALSLLFGILTINAQTDFGAVGDFYNFFQKLQFAAYGLLFYIYKLLIPVNLSGFYRYPAITNGTIPSIYLAYPVIALLVGAAVAYTWRYTKHIVYGVGFYLINLLLVLQFVTVGSALVADRYTYIPYIGLSLIIGYGVQYFIIDKQLKNEQLRNGLLGVFILWLGFLAFQTFNRTQVWENEEVFWTDVLDYNPKDWGALNSRGIYYRKAGKEDKALKDFNEAINIKSDFALALGNRGNIYFRRNDDEKALEDYNRAINADGATARIYANRGAAYMRVGQNEKAIADFNQSIAMDKQHANAYLNRGIYFATNKQHQKAIDDFTTYLRLDKVNNTDGIYNYRGISYQALNQHQKALKDFDSALRINAKQPIYYYNKALSHNALGNKAEALKNASKAKSMGYAPSDALIQNLN